MSTQIRGIQSQNYNVKNVIFIPHTSQEKTVFMLNPKGLGLGFHQTNVESDLHI